jgi:hypothetical protein
MRLTVVETRLAVCRLDVGSGVPPWVDQTGEFVSITRTADELSVVWAGHDFP